MQLNKLDANALLTLEKQKNPQNVAPYFLENYLDFFEIFINENKSYFEKHKQNKEVRLKKIETLADGNPWKNYAKAEILTHWSLAGLKFENYINSAFEARKAFKLVKENKTQFPDFVPNNKTLGFYHTLIGTIPNQYRFIVNLFGFSGDLKTGLEELKSFDQFAKTNDLFKEESKMLVLFLNQYVNNKETIDWQKVKTQLNEKNSLLENFLLANMAYRNNDALNTIKILENKPTGKKYLNFYYSDYILGLNKLFAMDSTANQHLQYFINEATNLHYKKDAWQKLAWYNLLMKQDTLQYKYCMQQCLLNGKLFVDADKQAQKEASDKKIPNVHLLKARLQCDGGFYQQAIKTLKPKQKLTGDLNIYDLSEINLSKTDKPEYIYRLGKIEMALKKYESAINKLKMVISLKNTDNNYFQPNSCMLIANIYEKLNNMEQAKNYYLKIFEYKNYSYQNSLEQKAKTALNRLKSD